MTTPTPTPTPTPSMRDLLRTRGAALVETDRDTAVDSAMDGFARLNLLMEGGKLPPLFIAQLGEYTKAAADAVDAGEPLPSIYGATPAGGTIKPEYRRLIEALDRDEVELDSDTGLPKPVDASAEIFNAIGQIASAIGVGKLPGDTPKQFTDRVKDEVVRLNTIASDKLGEVAEALGLKKDAKPDDIVAAAKAYTKAFNELFAEVKSQTGVETKAGESPKDYIGRAIEAAQAAKPGRRRFGG